MKISKPVLILSSAGLGLTLVYCGPGTNCTPNKAQLILRQKLAEMDTAESLPSKDQLLADVERLHKEGKISGQQFETFKKNINEQYVAPAIPTEPEAQVKAGKLLEQKITELNAAPPALTAPANAEVQTKAQQVLEQKLNEPPAANPVHPETGTVAQQVLRQKVAELRTEEKSNIVPERAAAALTPELEAKARELLRLKIAESRKGNRVQPETNTEAQAKALAILHRHDTELKAGITSDTPEMTRVLRLKVAESQGIITPEEAANAAGAQAAQTGRASSAGTPASVQQNASGPSAALLTFQTSNKIGLARLNELTEMYKADRITPHEYHHERAKIVATL